MPTPYSMTTCQCCMYALHIGKWEVPWKKGAEINMDIWHALTAKFRPHMEMRSFIKKGFALLLYSEEINLYSDYVPEQMLCSLHTFSFNSSKSKKSNFCIKLMSQKNRIPVIICNCLYFKGVMCFFVAHKSHFYQMWVATESRIY